MRMPQAGLREASSATTNSRSGIMAPGTIANKAMSMSRMETPGPPSQQELTPPEATRPKTANLETKRAGSVTRQPTMTTRAHTRGNSYASSTMSRSTTPASRTGPFSSTVGPGNRPTSAMSRPQSSLNGRRPVGASIPRAASALDTHMEDTSPSVLGKRKGTPQISLSPTRIPSCPVGNVPPKLKQEWNESSQLAMLSISESPATSLNHSVTTTVPEFPNTPFRCDPDGIRNPPELRTLASSSTLYFTPMTSCKVPSTSPRRINKKSSHPVFLTKGSSVRSFDHITGPEWDQDSREKNMDILMKKFMEQVSQQGQASSGLKETVDIYKSRGRPISPNRILG
jgi:hypothetical protein